MNNDCVVYHGNAFTHSYMKAFFRSTALPKLDSDWLLSHHTIMTVIKVVPAAGFLIINISLFVRNNTFRHGKSSGQ